MIHRSLHLALALAVSLPLCAGVASVTPAATPWQDTADPIADAADLARATAVPPDIGDGWPRSSLPAEKVEPAPIAILLRRIDEGGYAGIDSFLMARHGRLVTDRYYGDYNARALHQTRSTFKSITGLLVGIAVDEDLLGLQTPVAPLIARFHVPARADPRRSTITVEDLLQMSSGFDCREMPGRAPQREATANKSADKLAAHFDLPMADAPGTRWRYCSSNTYVLGVALESALLARTYFGLGGYLHDRLLGPLGITAYRLGGQSSVHLAMHGGARMRPRDLAKIGQLIVSGGRWRHRQVVPAGWIARIRAEGIETDWTWVDPAMADAAPPRPSRYQYQWFQTRLGAAGRDVTLIHSWGNGGQFIIAVPDRQLVVVVTGGNYGAARLDEQRQVFHMLQHYVLPATRN